MKTEYAMKKIVYEHLDDFIIIMIFMLIVVINACKANH